LPCRVMVLFAVCRQPQPGIGKGRHLYVPSAVIPKRAARESARLPGLVPAGTGFPPDQADLGLFRGLDGHDQKLRCDQGIAPIKVATVLPDAMHDDRELPCNRDLGTAHANPAGKCKPPCPEP
jgi:hypothetical protein